VVEAKVNWIDGERFAAIASSRHAIMIDSDRQGNSGPGPMEMVLMGLCACTATDVVSILRKKRQLFTAIEVHAEAERAPQPPTVYTSIRLVYTISGEVDRKAAEDAVALSEEKYCSVAAMLKSTARIITEIRMKAAENADETLPQRTK